MAFPFQDVPEALHRAVINAASNTGHALRHPCLHKLIVKYSARVLKTSVIMEQGMCVWIGLDRYLMLVSGTPDINIIEHIKMIETYIHYYNTRRVQRNLGVLTPMEKYQMAFAA